MAVNAWMLHMPFTLTRAKQSGSLHSSRVTGAASSCMTFGCDAAHARWPTAMRACATMAAAWAPALRVAAMARGRGYSSSAFLIAAMMASTNRGTGYSAPHAHATA